MLKGRLRRLESLRNSEQSPVFLMMLPVLLGLLLSWWGHTIELRHHYYLLWASPTFTEVISCVIRLALLRLEEWRVYSYTIRGVIVRECLSLQRRYPLIILLRGSEIGSLGCRGGLYCCEFERVAHRVQIIVDFLHCRQYAVVGARPCFPTRAFESRYLEPFNISGV